MTLLGPLRSRPPSLALVLFGEQPETICDQSEGAKHTGPLLMCSWVNEVRVLGAFQPAVDLFRVRHPLHQLIGRRPVGHQEGKDFLRRFDEKLTLPILRRLEQGYR